MYNRPHMTEQTNKRRRGFVKAFFGGAISTLMWPSRHSHANVDDERALQFFHTHTLKHLSIVYKRRGEFVPDALNEINAYLSDFRTGDVTEIDPQLLDLIYDLRETLGSKGTFEVISAYRSPKTNDMLRSRSSGVAKNSQHVLGKAIDVRLTDIELPKLRDTAIAMQRGGVGYYSRSNFVHIDTGRVRRW